MFSLGSADEVGLLGVGDCLDSFLDGVGFWGGVACSTVAVGLSDGRGLMGSPLVEHDESMLPPSMNSRVTPVMAW